MSKTKTKTEQTATVAPNQAYTPYINSAADQFKPAFDLATENNRGLLQRVNGALDFYGDTMSGKYLNGNPYLDGVISKSNQGITDAVDSRFSSAGRYGSGMHSGVLARAIADNENQLRFQNYGMERGLQNSAGQAIISGAGISAGLPQAASGAYADAINSLLGKYTTGQQSGTTTQSGGLLQSLIGAAGQIGGAAIAASDRRLKREIVKLGEMADGLGIYAWRYLWGQPSVGVMADEVADKRPWALGPTVHGFATVNYGAL